MEGVGFNTVSTKYIAPYKGIRYLESGEILLVESGIRKIVFCWIPNPGLWNPKQSSRNLESTTIGIRNPSCSGLSENPESKTWNPESKTVVDSLTGGDKTGFTE